MLELLTYDYLQRAIVAGIVIAVTAPIIGTFMVLKRLSLIGDTLSHTAFAGIALGALLNLPAVWSALTVTILGALGIAKIRQSAKISGEAALAVFFSAGLALGIFVISLSPRLSINLSSLLFGSILLVTWLDVLLVALIGLASSLVVMIFFKEFVHITLDEELARASGLPVSRFNYVLSILIAVMVVAAMRIVGILLVSALLVIPPLASIQISRSFRQTIVFSILFAILAVLVGMILAIILNASPGGTIVLTAVGLFLVTLPLKKIKPSALR